MRHRCSISLLSLLLVFPRGSDAQVVSRLQTRPLAEVPFTLHQSAIILPAVINGRDTVRLLLDTGWGPLALVRASAERLRLPVSSPGADGLGRAQLASLAVGNAVQNRPLVEVFPTEALAPLIGPYDGILSTSFFRDLVLQIDYPAGLVRFYRSTPVPSAPVATSSRASVPMVFSGGAGALPFSDSIYVDGRPVRSLFDTGGAGAFLATRQLVDRMGLRPIADSGRAFMGMLSNDTVARQPIRFTRVGRISLGMFTVDSPRVIMAPPQLSGQGWGHDLIIGYGFMRHYVVTFDYPNRLVTFERPAGATPRPPAP